jgi:hypothetical protein
VSLNHSQNPASTLYQISFSDSVEGTIYRRARPSFSISRRVLRSASNKFNHSPGLRAVVSTLLHFRRILAQPSTFHHLRLGYLYLQLPSKALSPLDAIFLPVRKFSRYAIERLAYNTGDTACMVVKNRFMLWVWDPVRIASSSWWKDKPKEWSGDAENFSTWCSTRLNVAWYQPGFLHKCAKLDILSYWLRVWISRDNFGYPRKENVQRRLKGSVIVSLG